MLKTFISVLLLFYSFNTATSDSFYQYTINDIDYSSVEQIVDLVDNGNRVHLILNSGGGLINPTFQLAEAIQRNKKVTGKVIKCLSACVTIAGAIGKNNLEVDALSSIGVHAAYFPVEGSRSRIPVDDYSYYKKLYDIFTIGGFNANFLVGKSIGTRPEDMSYLSIKEMKEAGFINE